MNRQKLTEYISAFAAILYGCFFLIGSLMMDTQGRAGDVGSAFMPRLVGILIVSLGVIYLLLLLFKKSHNSTQSEETQPTKYNVRGLLMTSILLIAYVVIMPVLGFTVSSIFYVFIQMMLLAVHPTKRQILMYAVISLIVPILVYFIFTNCFSLLLPSGIFG